MRLAERFAIPPEDELDNLEAELMDYQLSESDDLPPYERGVTRLDKWWAEVGALKTGTGEARFPNLFTLMQCLLILPHSTAQVEGVFSLVRRIKTEFRASLENSSLCALLACKTALVLNSQLHLNYFMPPNSQQMSITLIIIVRMYNCMLFCSYY